MEKNWKKYLSQEIKRYKKCAHIYDTDEYSERLEELLEYCV